MKKINFAKLTDKELKAYLTHYCLELPMDENGKFFRPQAIRTLISYQDMLESEEDRRIKVLFHRTGDPTQGNYVFIGHNGRGYQVPFDKEVVLPESVVRVCDRAVATIYRQSGLTSAYGKVEHNSNQHRLYPYTLIEYMDPEGMMVPKELLEEDD